MHAHSLSPSSLPFVPDRRPGRANAPISRGSRAGLQLRMLSLVDPPVMAHEGNPRAAGLWVSDEMSQVSGERAVTTRHLELQGVLLRLEMLAGPEGLATNRALRLLTGSELTHVHASSSDFGQLAADFTPLGSDDTPIAGVAFIDETRDWLVLDAERSFIGGGTRPAPALIAALAQLAELPYPARRRLHAVSGPTEGAETWRALMLEAARKLTRRSLGEPGVGLSERAGELAQQLGPMPLIQWLLSDLPMPVAQIQVRRASTDYYDPSRQSTTVQRNPLHV
jgi:hypothetical protein